MCLFIMLDKSIGLPSCGSHSNPEIYTPVHQINRTVYHHAAFAICLYVISK